MECTNETCISKTIDPEKIRNEERSRAVEKIKDWWGDEIVSGSELDNLIQEILK